MNPVTLQQVGVALTGFTVLFVALGIFRSIMKDLKTEIRSDLAGLEAAINGVKGALTRVTIEAATKTELSGMSTTVRENRERIVRMEGQIEVLQETTERGSRDA